MSENKSGLLPRIEIIIIAVFFIGFLLWAMSRCNSTRDNYAAEDLEEVQADSLMRAMNQTTIIEKARKDSITAAAKEIESRTIRERITPLYTTVEKVNVRREPKLTGAVVSRLELGEEVTFLNEVTDFKQTIIIEEVEKTEPWIKVKTQAGRIGWVYGGTVSYYKVEN